MTDVELTPFQLIETPANVDDFVRLRAETGLSTRSREAAALGLPNSLYGVHILHNGTVVGMGRIVGDGGCNYEIVDVAVSPQYQGKGLGKRIMNALMDWLHVNAPHSAYVSMVADKPSFYVPLGFKDVHPSLGMAMIINKE